MHDGSVKKAVCVFVAVALVFVPLLFITGNIAQGREGDIPPPDQGPPSSSTYQEQNTGTAPQTKGDPFGSSGSHGAYVSRTDTFAPDESLTRGETALIIYNLLNDKTANSAISFYDVSQGDWYYDAVRTLVSAGAVSGYPDGGFHPGNYVTRAEFVSIVSRFFDIPSGVWSGFPDVDNGHWARDAIAYAKTQNWVSGYPNGNFGPNDLVTRAEAVAILNRVANRRPDRAYIDAQGKPMRFVDVPPTNWAYYDIMEATVGHSAAGSGDGESWTQSPLGTSPQTSGDYRIIDGELYKTDGNGNFLTNVQDGFLYFGADGRYTTGDAVLDGKLSQIVRYCAVNGEGRDQTFRNLYRYVCANYHYIGRGLLTEGTTGFENGMALQMIDTGGGNCYNFAALTALLARKAGYQAKAVAGTVLLPWNTGYISHAWTEVTIDGVTYICDSQQENNAPNRGYSWDIFLKRYDEIPPDSVMPHYMLFGQKLN